MAKAIYFAFVVQCIVLYGGIDLNFKTPLLTDLPQFRTTDQPPADRLVLIISDGLRAERLYEGLDVTPHLNEIRRNRGVWGISIASVPTESRPGHVSLLAGIYEDPSAIFRGWQDNPVDFDSVINQSANAYGWGSPDILNLFNKGNHPHINFYTYPREMQSFDNPSINLDRWVMEKVNETFQNVSKKPCMDFCMKKNIFFLHLLGMDNAGHAYKPHSKEYKENLEYVDTVVKSVETLFETFFDDSKTAYIFTADHGMTDWGSHGSGSDHETHVPIIAWGAGISRGKVPEINETDLAPLMAALIGINIPTNSLGRLPYQYLDVDDRLLAKMTFANAKQFAALYTRLEDSRSNSVNFKPFVPLSEGKSLKKELAEISKEILEGRYKDAIRASRELMDVLEKGRKYYFDYFKKPLVDCLVLSLYMWSAYLIISSVTVYNKLSSKSDRVLPLLCIGTGTMFTSYVAYVNSLPLVSTFYMNLPIICSSWLIGEYEQVCNIIKVLRKKDLPLVIVGFAAYTTGTYLLYASFFKRSYIILVVLGIILWCWTQLHYVQKPDKIKWIFYCLCTTFFTLLPPVATFNVVFHLSGVLIWMFAVAILMKRVIQNKFYTANKGEQPFIVKIQLVIFILCLMIGVYVRLQNNVTTIVHAISWCLLGSIIVLPFHPTYLLRNRLLSLLISFMSYYALVSVSYELLFMFCYVGVLYQWIINEDKLLHHGKSMLSSQGITTSHFIRPLKTNHDLRDSLMILQLTFTLLGFLGMGNLASISSFDPMWVKPLVTSFSPFLITGLIILKISIPFMMCTMAIYAINSLAFGKIRRVFTIMLGFCDIMLVHFLQTIQTDGSWLEIGTSLSRFIICGVILLIFLFYYQLSETLVTKSLPLY